MQKYIRSAITLCILFTLLFGIAYPAVSTSIIKLFFAEKSEGSLIIKEGKVIGSELIGQNFSDPKCFWGRLSITGSYPYNAAASSGSNMGAANPVLLEVVQARIDALKVADPNNKTPIPVDLVTASASGLDPHISISAAEYQVARIARMRGISEDSVKEIVKRFTEARQLRILGEPRVNVLKVNLALDRVIQNH